MTANALLTDLYELTMLQAYFAQRMNGVAVFELFVRKLPAGRSFLMAAGLAQVVEYLEDLHFTEDELAWLQRTGRFTPGFCSSLAELRFTGDVNALPEGTVFFADEPVLQIVAPLREAQLVESRVMNLVHYQTLVASKAARCVLAAPERALVDFGLRRAHGAEAGLLSARASYIAGFAGTATVAAGQRFDIPIFGTMAHSYVQAHGDESAAFESFARTQPANAVLLIDTYDTERAAHEVIALARRLGSEGIAIKGVRIDSGDLGEHARRVRAILDAAGCREISIFASGNLDEYRLRDLVAAGAPIDSYGVGTRMNTSADAPYLDCAYKLEEYEGLPRRKRSEGKATWPGRKQVHRRYGQDGRIVRDVLTLAGESVAGEALLEPVMRAGRRIGPPTPLGAIRAHARQQLAMLPPALRGLDAGAAFEVEIAPSLALLAAEIDART